MVLGLTRKFQSSLKSLAMSKNTLAYLTEVADGKNIFNKIFHFIVIATFSPTFHESLFNCVKVLSIKLSTEKNSHKFNFLFKKFESLSMEILTEGGSPVQLISSIRKLDLEKKVNNIFNLKRNVIKLKNFLRT